MWPECIEHLSPFACEIKPYTPEFLEEEWNTVKPIGEYKAHLPVRLVSLLGHCPTAAYPECPTLPEHHKINARLYAKNLQEWLNFMREGRYYWLDFDIVWRPSDSLQLRIPLTSQERTYNKNGWNNASSMPVRMAYNTGTGTADGIWGVAWHRDTAEVIANLNNWGSDETTIHATSQRYASVCEAHLSWIPVSLWERTHRDYPIDKTELHHHGSRPARRVPLYYASGAKIERLIGLAIDLCEWYAQTDAKIRDFHR